MTTMAIIKKKYKKLTLFEINAKEVQVEIIYKQYHALVTEALKKHHVWPKENNAATSIQDLMRERWSFTNIEDNFNPSPYEIDLFKTEFVARMKADPEIKIEYDKHVKGLNSQLEHGKHMKFYNGGSDDNPLLKKIHRQLLKDVNKKLKEKRDKSMSGATSATTTSTTPPPPPPPLSPIPKTKWIGNEHERSITILNNKKFRLFGVEGDGHCMFYAVIAALRDARVEMSFIDPTQPKENQQFELRKLIVDYIKEQQNLPENKRLDIMKHILPIIDELLNDLLNAEWGSEPILAFIEHILAVNINVWNARTKKWTREQPTLLRFDVTIYLYFTGSHYDWLKPQLPRI